MVKIIIHFKTNVKTCCLSKVKSRGLSIFIFYGSRHNENNTESLVCYIAASIMQIQKATLRKLVIPPN